MKTLALMLLALMVLSTSSFAAEPTTAVAPDNGSSTFLDLPESLQRAVIWARLLSFAPEGGFSVIQLAQYMQAVDAAIEGIKAYKATLR